jgi:hypothetical protein
MQDFDIYGVQNGGPGVEYPEGGGNGSLSAASTITKGDCAPGGVSAGDVLHCQTMNLEVTQVTQAVRVVK